MLSAVMHAAWNLVVKKDDDKFLSLTVMAATSGGICLAMLPFFPAMEPGAWKWLAVSAPLHAGYRICLSAGYKHGDMSQVYPIARGATPLMVTAISVLLLGTVLAPWKYVGIAVIGVGIMGLSFSRGVPKRHEGRAIAFALATAAFIAVFTLLDSQGARVSGQAFTYVLWLFVLEGLLMLLIAAATGFSRLQSYVARNGRNCLVNGFVMSAAHGLVIIALSRSQPALVSALRETSVVFGALFGAIFLKEKVTGVRLTCTLFVTVGLVVSVLG
ncbi:EamA family transporter [Acidovorax sp. PRC11]|uniref:EamA family transporter n=1 Tax=Acidovorax sp. PRC11 TaxID=2962592 RepID=UPI0028818021|nr:EamA family transporter [Acidovorax sp. PRC11]MDT0140335.1 EamA family transporter [Acidovorax sp. PRC11]